MRPLLSARTHLRTCLIPGANARKARIPSWPARVLVTVTLALLAACSQQELYGQLTERQANEMVAVLRNAGLHAEKAASRDGKAFEPGSIPDGFYLCADSEAPEPAFQQAVIAAVAAKPSSTGIWQSINTAS